MQKQTSSTNQYGKTFVAQMTPSRVLVVAATGRQGSSVTKQLLEHGHSVHAVTRDTESAQAKRLESAGAKLFRGSFDSVSSLKSAAEGCEAMFLVLPSGESEVEHGRNAVMAARAVQVKKCIYSSIANCEKVTQRPDFDHAGFRASYFLRKLEIQDLVAAQFPSWTILQPASLMEGMVNPLAHWFWPNLGARHVMDGPWKPDFAMDWVDTVDIGKFTVMAVETDRLEHQIVPLSGEKLDIFALSTLMSRISGKSITVDYVGDEAVEKNKDTNPIYASAAWISKGWLDVDVEGLKKSWPEVDFNSVEQFLTRQNDSGLLEEALQAK